jgi:hypothetical protein
LLLGTKRFLFTFDQRSRFLRSQKEVQASINHFLKKERWMPNLRQQTRRSAVWPIQQYFLQIVPKKGLLICTSSLQVLCHYLQVKCVSVVVFL